MVIPFFGENFFSLNVFNLREGFCSTQQKYRTLQYWLLIPKSKLLNLRSGASLRNLHLLLFVMLNKDAGRGTGSMSRSTSLGIVDEAITAGWLNSDDNSNVERSVSVSNTKLSNTTYSSNGTLSCSCSICFKDMVAEKTVPNVMKIQLKLLEIFRAMPRFEIDVAEVMLQLVRQPKILIEYCVAN
ncbi:hypothetical protein BDF20DRAFT_831754 [Mycotypha africana]|uniref:uncharacterized protein n=1 Tax=Mycotypha africana TaxID=64632 RepID=UPI00230113C1|nr:uncharacterized protein BDF20DRAFT_831754 [Mycotypha africana]KAI8991739.1 hypothetical protein BDF20DRAFT_831754 [Mycotypha africana]